jgi:hypothetical protein
VHNKDGRREQTRLIEDGKCVPYVDISTGDRVLVPIHPEDAAAAAEGRTDNGIPVVVVLALSSRAVERSARALGFGMASNCPSLVVALEDVTATKSRMPVLRQRLGRERQVGLIAEMDGLSSLSGTLTLTRIRMDVTGATPADRIRRRVGTNTVIAHGVLVVRAMEEPDADTD